MKKNKDQLTIDMPKRSLLSDEERAAVINVLNREVEKITSMNQFYDHLHPSFLERKEIYLKILSKLN